MGTGMKGWRWTSPLRMMFPVTAQPGILALSLLGCVCGLLAGLAISALHHLIDFARWLFEQPGVFSMQSLPQLPTQFWASVLGALLVGLIFQFIKARHRHTGLVHIVERLMHHQGQLPTRNAWANFLGTVIAAGSGQVVGREGAAMHLGASGGSMIGKYLELPHSTVRALVGCGAAAGISASFNTPLAGVIFTMEVIIMEYSVLGLAPTIVAAVSANAVAHLWLTAHPTLSVSVAEIESLSQLPILLAVGATLGLIATYYQRAIAWLTVRAKDIPTWINMSATGLITALFAMALPLTSVDGFININQALAGDMPLSTSLMLGGIVLICSSLAIATAIPGGIIMPCMLVGACLGSALGHLSAQATGLPAEQVALFALLGLGAMFGAVLQAPLTALIVILELSGRTDMVFAAMITVITAVLVCRETNHGESIVSLLLKNRGLDYRNDPVSRSLRRLSVIPTMNRNFAVSEESLTLDQARDLLRGKPDWLLVRPEKSPAFVIGAADVQYAVTVASEEDDDGEEPRLINLAKIPGDRRQCAPVPLRASLQEASETFDSSGVEALYVERTTRNDPTVIYGILTRKAIDKAYRT